MAWSGLVLALALTLGQAAVAATADKQRADHIVAVVNSELVTSVELAVRMGQMKEEAERQGRPVPAADALRQQALDSLIDERVQITYARDAGYKVDEVELDRAVQSVAAQNRLSVADLRERLKADGIDYGRFRSNLRDQIMVERVREREVIGRIRVSDAEIDQALRERATASAGTAQLNLAQILVKVPEGASVEQVAELRQRIDQAAARVRAGEDFAAVAKAVSEDANKGNGGEIGLRPADRLPDLFVQAVQGLGTGEVVAQPLRSGAGFHLLKVVERRDGQALRVTQSHARHILLRVPDGIKPEAVAARMSEVRADIVAGRRSFAEAAKAISEDASAAEGGDLGWVGTGQFVPEFEAGMDPLKPGEVSQPVVSRFGVHLIELIDRREVDVDPKALRDQISNQLRGARFEREYAEWIKELRLRSFIDLRESSQ